jgi:hypothetical protein
MNIEELDERGSRVAVWCFLPEGRLALGDIMLAQKIALETNERAALAVANRGRRTRASPPKPSGCATGGISSECMGKTSPNGFPVGQRGGAVDPRKASSGLGELGQIPAQSGIIVVVEDDGKGRPEDAKEGLSFFSTRPQPPFRRGKRRVRPGTARGRTQLTRWTNRRKPKAREHRGLQLSTPGPFAHS